MLQSDSTQTIDHIQKCFRQKFQCSRRPSYWTTLFFSVEALKLRQGQLHISKWNYVFFLGLPTGDARIDVPRLVSTC